jgi:hypothetical protein
VIVSPGRTARQVDQVPHTEPLADFPQLHSGGRKKKTAQQPTSTELFRPVLPVLGSTAQPLKDPGQLRRDRRLTLAKEPTPVVDQLHVVPQLLERLREQAKTDTEKEQLGAVIEDQLDRCSTGRVAVRMIFV